MARLENKVALVSGGAVRDRSDSTPGNGAKGCICSGVIPPIINQT